MQKKKTQVNIKINIHHIYNHKNLNSNNTQYPHNNSFYNKRQHDNQ